jgi:DNA repair exonuclease SbcCD ATPase subunit
MQDDVKSYETQISALEKRAERAEAALAETKAELEKQKTAWKEEKEEKEVRIDQDRRGWLEDLQSPAFRGNIRSESPQLTTQRTFSSDLLGLEGFANRSRKPSAPSSNGGGGVPSGDRSFSRRTPTQPQSRSPHPSAVSLFSPMLDSLPTPTANPMDREDAFEGVETGSSPQNVMQDMVSVSTVAAGPSVQLVERMSAAIRRLESEKVTAKEELTRISSQRDEARAEIVTLMKEMESSKAATQRVADLEAEVADVNARYETTLELLGEKSELVEELRADVDDVKAMYRDLIERTVK